jgi:hypothetical protein
LIFGEKLPDCNQPDIAILNIHQSGVYLNGSLLSTNNNTQKTYNTEIHPTLSGRYKNKNISLSGQVLNSVICKNANSENKDNYKTVNIQMQIHKQDNLSGQITVSGMNKPIKISATPNQKLDASVKLNNY